MNKNNLLYNYLNYAWQIILITFLIFCVGLHRKNKIIVYFSLVFLGIILFFFRNPNIKIIKDNSAFISPSESKITEIKELENQYYIKSYLSPLDLHFQVSPIKGKVVSIQSNPSKTDLERIKVGIMNSNGRVVFVEQAVKKPGYWGYLPNLLIGKRVIVNVKVGDELEQGERYGIVRFGSEMAYYIPKNFKIVVKEEQKCEIGQTKIAKLK